MASIYNKISRNVLRSSKLTINEKYVLLRALFCGKYENIKIEQFQLKKTAIKNINDKFIELNIFNKKSNNSGINYSVNIEVLRAFVGDDNEKTYHGYINISRALVESNQLSAGEIVVLCMLQTYTVKHCYKYYITAKELGTTDYLLRKYYKTLEEKGLVETYNKYLPNNFSSSSGCYRVKYVRIKYDKLISITAAVAPMPEVSFEELLAFEPEDTRVLLDQMKRDFSINEELPVYDYKSAAISYKNASVLQSCADRIAEIAMRRTGVL